uniref:Low-density lipoprotein receptor-related protein 10-like n=1 Tax=Saccoglossus kowalevskii TaxID=10224 RepID=A0ABM0MLF4_SACKO|nr:PREDICTED: low-density lipoprotein receptor-related protein 10-like [Saccoglossus kowalevskii]
MSPFSGHWVNGHMNDYGIANRNDCIYPAPLHYMARWYNCIEKIDASIKGGRVRSQAHVDYAKEIDCTMTIEADKDQRILLHFEMFVTNSNTQGEGYEFIFSAVTYARVTHTCPRDGDFRCENALCIASELQCDGNDNCGDGTDESNSQYEANCPLPWTDIIGNILRLGNAAIVAILALLILLVISLICLIACCCRKSKCVPGNKRKKRYIKYSHAVRGEIAGSSLQYQHVNSKSKKDDTQQSTLRSYTPAIMEGGFLGDEFLKGGRKQCREVYRPIREDSFPQLPTPSNTPVDGGYNRDSVTPSALKNSDISAMLTSLEKQQRRESTEEHDCHDI